MRKGRTTVYNQIVTEEKMKSVNEDNITLMNDFLDYLRSIDRAQTTIASYLNDLRIFWCWNLDYNENKFFVDINKREFAKFQSYGLNTLGWSSNRMRRVKSALSSLSNYIENICDDEYENYRSVVRKIESPTIEPVREKTILSEEELQKLLDTLIERGEYQRACAVSLAVNCGCRKSELLRFKVEYFDEENIQYDSYYKTPERIKTKGRGKGKFIYKYTLIEFKKYLDLWLAERERLGVESEWLFVAKEGDHYKQASVSLLNDWTNEFTEILGVPFYWHMLRHFITTRFRKYNIPSNVIVEWIGWNDETMIRKYDDNEISDDFWKYFTPEGVQSQQETSITDI